MWKVRKTDMPTMKLTPQIITAAIDGYEAQKTRIDTTLAELRAMLSGDTAKPEPQKLKRRKMSAEGRKAISEATKNRWAAFHAAKQAEQLEQTAPEKGKLKSSAPAKTSSKAPAKAAKKTTPGKKAAAKPEPETESQ